jgi:hypothetical protein
MAIYGVRGKYRSSSINFPMVATLTPYYLNAAIPGSLYL